MARLIPQSILGVPMARIISLFNLLFFCLSVGSFAWLMTWPQIAACSGLIVGAVLLALFGVGGHALVSMYLTEPGLRRGVWAWKEEDDASRSSNRTVAESRKDAAARTEAASGSAGVGVAYSPLSDSDHDEGLKKKETSNNGAVSRLGVWRALFRFPKCCKSRPMRGIVCGVTCVGIAFLYSMAIIGLWLRMNTVANASGSIVISSLIGSASITRSGEGVLRIVADNEHDLWVAQGAAHAQTRLWQLEFQRRLASGTLSEAVGSGGLTPDKLFRTLGVYSAAQRDYDRLLPSDPVKMALDSYAVGVNGFINAATSVNGGEGHFLPLEFRVLGLTPAPWTAVDSLVWAKVMSWDLSGNIDAEMQRFKLLVGKNATVQRISQLVPPFNTTRFPTVLSDADLLPPNQIEVEEEGEGGDDVQEKGQPLLPSHLEARIRKLATASSSSASSTASAVADAVAVGTAAVEARLAAARKGGKAATSALPLLSGLGLSQAPLHIQYAGLMLSFAQFIGDAALWMVGKGESSSQSSSPTSATTSSAPDSGSGHGSFRRQRRVGASNNWVVGGNLTASGSPLLCNDPHLQLLAPSLWQLTHLSCPACGIESIGAAFAGLPGVVIGRTRTVAWAVTNTGVDVQDLYIMNDNPNNSSEYFFGGGYLPYEVKNEVIHVSGDSDVLLTVRVGRYGPVVTDNDVMDTGITNGPPLSLRWVSIDPTISDTTFSAFYALQRASNWTTFRDALSLWTAPSQNVLFADTAGNIGYQMPGYIPTRNKTAGHTGAYPVPGDDPSFDWQAAIPFDNLPRTHNPPEGFIVSANNQVIPPNSPPITTDWDGGSEGYRALRITDLVKAGVVDGKKHTPASMAAIQADTVAYFARDIVSALYNISTSLFTPTALALVRHLSAWDKNTPVGSAEATIWASLYRGLSQLASSETGETYWNDPVYILNALASDFGMGRPDPACLSSGYTSCSAFAAAVVNNVVSQYSLQMDAGGGITSTSLSSVPQWGVDIHHVLVAHELLHASPLACIGDRVIGHGGDAFTVNVGSFSFDTSKGDPGDFTQDHGPSYRHIVDLDPTAMERSSQFVHPMGVEGAPFSHTGGGGNGQYDNLLSYWADGTYVQMSMDAQFGESEILTLNPA